MHKVVLIFLIQFAILFSSTAESRKKSKHIAREPVPDKVVAVDDGVAYTHQFYPRGHWSIHTVTADLSNPDIQMLVTKGLDHVAGLERVQSMAHKHDSLNPTTKVLAGINSNFWKAGSNHVIGPTISDGIFINNVKYKNWTSFAITQDHHLHLDRYAFDISVRSPKGNWNVQSFNRRFDSTSVTIYSHFFGASVPFIDTIGVRLASQDTLQDETELDSATVAVLDSLWTINPEKGTVKIQFEYRSKPVANSNIKCVVTAIDTGTLSIPANGGVLSFGHQMSMLSKSFVVGDSFTISSNTIPDVKSPILQMITATPRLVRNGMVSVEWQDEGLHKWRFVIGRYGRSAIGISRDGKKIFFVTAERTNRRKGIRGIGLIDLAKLLVAKGAYQAMNCDGGSSATMIVRDKTVAPEAGVNFSRKVASALFIVKNLKNEQAKQ